MSVFWRYWLLQVPGWGLLTVVLVAAHRWFHLEPLVGAAIFVAWIVKDAAVYPWLKHAYEHREVLPHAYLIGREGVARQPLNPTGYVWVRGELWAAKAVATSTTEASIPEGASVVVESVEGMTLGVRLAGTSSSLGNEP